jgi:hypothetical protein
MNEEMSTVTVSQDKETTTRQPQQLPPGNLKNPLAFYRFENLWDFLERLGWKEEQDSVGSSTYIRPGCSTDNSNLLNQDYFTDEAGVIRFCEEHSYHLRQHSSLDYPSFSKSYWAFYRFENLWPLLERLGWKTESDCNCFCPLVYIRPGCSTDNGNHLGQDYFLDQTGVIRFCQEHSFHLRQGCFHLSKSDLTFYRFKNLWPLLKRLGWKRVSSSYTPHPLYYIRPGCSIDHPNIFGEDYFPDRAGVIRFCQEHCYHQRLALTLLPLQDSSILTAK